MALFWEGVAAFLEAVGIAAVPKKTVMTKRTAAVLTAKPRVRQAVYHSLILQGKITV